VSRTALTTLASQLRDRAAQMTQRRRLTALHDPGLALGGTRLELMPRGSQLQVQVRHEIRQIGPLHGRGLVLDLTSCPFMLDDIRCSRASRVYQHLAGLVVEPDRGGDLTGGVIEYVFCWDPRASSSTRPLHLLQFPDDFPTSLPELPHNEMTSGFSIGPWQVIKDELIHDIVVGGVPSSPSGGERVPNSLLRGFILSQDSLRRRETQSSSMISVTRASAALFHSSTAVDGLIAAAEQALQFLSMLFGRPSTDRVLIAGPGDRKGFNRQPSFGGPIVYLDQQFAARYRPNSLGMRFEMVRELCSAYWGGACRVLGRGSGELTAAIGAAVALYWAATHAGDSYTSQTKRSFGKLATRSRLLDYLETALGGMSGRLVGALSHRLFEKLSDEEYRRKLATLTNELWGMYVPYGAARRELDL
jgi:hypothetical protein